MRQPQHPQPVVEVVLPDRRVPLEQVLAAPDVVDEHVEPSLLARRCAPPAPRPASRSRGGRPGTAMPGPPAAVDELGGLLDRLGRSYSERRSRVLRPVHVDRRARLAEPDRDAAARAAGGSCHQRNHAVILSIAAARTRVPPASWSAPSVSPKITNASTTVASGSTVDRIDALVGPTRRRPAKKSPIAPTVDTAARQPIQPQPAARQRARPEVAEQRRRRRPGSRRARAHERGQHARRQAAHDAVADEDVGAVEHGRSEPEPGAERVERARRRRSPASARRTRRPARRRAGARRSRPSATAATATSAGEV